MTSEAMVVMEQGSRWPAWVDDHDESSIWVLAQRDGERYESFAGRSLERIRSIVRGSGTRQAFFVCNGQGGAGAMSSRRTLLRALLYEMSLAGGGQVIAAIDGSAAHRRELCAIVAELADELDAEDGLTLRIRALPSERPPSLLQVA